MEQKHALIERLKAVDLTKITTAKQWNDAQQTIQTIQDEWRKIGFAPKKHNQAIYEEYRNLCNAFYKARTAFFKERRDELSENLKAKRSLIDRATELLNSEQWQEKADEMRNLQKEWKTVGPVIHKLSDEVWQQFTAICDQFFEKKRGVDKSARDEREKARTDKTMQSGDRSKLMRLYENLQQEIKTAENNILFFTGKSKSGNRIVEDMQKKIDIQKQQLKEIEGKINALDNEENA